MVLKLSKKKSKKNETPISIDKVVINENSGNATGTVTLSDKNDSILIDNGRLLYIEQGSKKEDQVNINTFAQGSILKSVKRSFLADENIFINKFTGSDSGKPVEVHFGSASPGDIARIIIEPNESFTVSSGSFLAASSNLNISARLNIRGVLSGEGIGLTYIKNKSSENGHVYIGCFGKALQIKVKRIKAEVK